MADDAERMAALKKAYADIILNTAKESAARILAADQRTAQWQHGLSVAKKEALAMLLRLKAIMDSKIKESEKVNLSQARKIEELEFELCEAKHTIHHLNSVLKKVNSESGSDKSHKTEILEVKETDTFLIPLEDDCRKDTGACASAPGSQSGTICSTNYDINACSLSWRAVPHSCLPKYTTEGKPPSDLIASDDSSGNPDLVSLILRNKEPDLFRNGCTQRIRALEQSIMMGRELPAQEHNEFSDTKQVDLAFEDRLAETDRVQDPPPEMGMVIPIKESLESEKMGDEGNNTHETTGKIKFPCQRSTRKHRVKRFLVKSFSSYHNKEEHEQSYMSNSKVACDMPITCEKMRDSSKDTYSCLDLASANRNKKLNKPHNHVIPGILGVSRIMTRQSKKLGDIKSENHCDGSTITVSPHFVEDNIKEEDARSTFDMEDGAPLHHSGMDDAIDAQLDCEQMLTTPHHKIDGYNLITSDSKGNHGNIGAPLTKCDSSNEGPCNSNGFPSEDGNERVLKYTFKRTRKRRSSDSKTEIASLEENNKSKRKGDKQSALLEPSKPNIENESTRENRRLAQVARQLISLSEKRWW